MFVECPFCHQQVPKAQYAAHEQQHTQLLPDGQMQDHINLRQEERYRGSLGNVPQDYEHRACGGVTRMPEEVIRSYLADPFLYNDQSFCTGCNRYVPTQELFWIETGEQVFRYNQDLRRDYLLKQGVPAQEIRYAANGTVLKPKKAGSAGCIVAAILGVVALLGVSGVVAVAGLFWFIGRPKPRPAPVIAAPPAPAIRPHAAPFEDMQERMRKQQEEHRKMFDDMQRRHEEMRERLREQAKPGF